MTALSTHITRLLNRGIRSLRPVSGGDAAEAYHCITDDGAPYFVKTVTSGSPFRMEARGLQLLDTPGGVRVPNVIAVDDRVLILEHLPFERPGPGYQEELGRKLAITHQSCRSDAYGFEGNHVIGLTPQQNLPQVPFTPLAWAEFWWTHRLQPMLERIQDPDTRRLGIQLEPRLPDLIGAVEEPPSLIHGDLWSGNVAADDQGAPVMFDPAPSYSHREAELGMTRLFGGFTDGFYDAYNETFPLAEGWRERQDLYMLYHVLNHAVIFGPSYLGNANAILNRYV
jgi:fructosamine-3-kinase